MRVKGRLEAPVQGQQAVRQGVKDFINIVIVAEQHGMTTYITRKPSNAIGRLVAVQPALCAAPVD